MMEVGVMSGLRPDGRNLDEVGAFGLKCAQVVSWGLDLCTTQIAKACKQNAVDNGVTITALWSGVPGPAVWNFTEGPFTLGFVPPEYRQTRIDALKRWADFAVELGAPAIITHCGFIPECPCYPDYVPTRIAIGQVARHCQERGIGFWFETGQETPHTLLRVIQDLEKEGIRNLGINLDPANLILYGRGNPIDAVGIFGNYIKSVHAKDGVYATDGNSMGRETPVGEGQVRFPEFIAALHAIGFSGDLTIECELGGEQNATIAKTVTDLRRWVSELK